MDNESMYEHVSDEDLKEWNLGSKIDYLLRTTDEETIVRMTMFAETKVREVRPHAKIIFSQTQKGVTTFVGVYDCPLALDINGRLKTNKKWKPQFLGDELAWHGDGGSKRHKAIAIIQAWSGAWMRLMELGELPTLDCCVGELRQRYDERNKSNGIQGA